MDQTVIRNFAVHFSMLITTAFQVSPQRLLIRIYLVIAKSNRFLKYIYLRNGQGNAPLASYKYDVKIII